MVGAFATWLGSSQRAFDKGIDMEVWRLSLTITRAISGYGLVAAGMSAFAVVAHDSSALPHTNADFGKSRLANSAANAGEDQACDTTKLNTCTPRAPMRALSPKEVALIMGANSDTNGQTSRSHTSYTSHGSCSAGGCHTTATIPPSGGPSGPPVTSGPPASSLGGGGGGATNVPNSQQQAHLTKCAEVYGHTSPNPKFTTNYTNDYGWSFYAHSTGLPVVHDTTTNSDPPAYTPSVPGGGEWLAVSASTFFQNAPYHTDVYVYAYSTDATTVGVLVHEWYHQNNDVPNESQAQRQTNENNATAAGVAAENAYKADNGAQCAN
jgi:hypothetical protein